MVSSHLSCTLYWNKKKFKKTVPGCFHYQAFISTFEVLKVCPVPHKETIILLHMIQQQREQDSEFIAEENLLGGSEGAKKHTPSTSNEAPQSQDQMGSLSFYFNPPSNEMEDQISLEADDTQAELI